MPTKNINLRTEEICSEDTVIAQPDAGNVRIPIKDYTLRFHNKLDNDAEATVTFHDFSDKELGAELGDFCKNHPGVDTFTIDNKTFLDCEPDAAGDFAYIVQGTDHVTLDPVIIIKPDFTSYLASPLQPDPPTFPGGEFGAYALIAFSAPLFLGLLGGIYIGRKMGK